MKKVLFLLITGLLLSFSSYAQNMGKQMEMRLKKLSTALSEAGLDLSKDQYAELTKNFETVGAKMKALRSSENMDRSEVAKIRRSSDMAVKNILNEKQYTVFKNMDNARTGGIKPSKEGATSRPNKGQGAQGGGSPSKPSKGKIDNPSKEMNKASDVQEDHRGHEHMPENRNKKEIEKADKALEKEKMQTEKEMKAKEKEIKAKEKEMKASEKEMKDMEKEMRAKEKEMKSMEKEQKAQGKENKAKAEKMRQNAAHAKSMENQGKISSMLADANMPLSDSQAQELKSIMKREQKKIGSLVEKSGEGSKDYLKGLKKIKKSSVRKMKDVFSAEQFKFIKKQWR